MSKQRINHLLQKYLSGNISDTERQELSDLCNEVSLRETEYPDDRESVNERMLNRLNSSIAQEKQRSTLVRKIPTATYLWLTFNWLH